MFKSIKVVRKAKWVNFRLLWPRDEYEGTSTTLVEVDLSLRDYLSERDHFEKNGVNEEDTETTTTSR